MGARITIEGAVSTAPKISAVDGRGYPTVSFAVAIPRRRVFTDGSMQEDIDWYRVRAHGMLALEIADLTEQGRLTIGTQVRVRGRFDPARFTRGNGSTTVSLRVDPSSVELIDEFATESDQDAA